MAVMRYGWKANYSTGTAQITQHSLSYIPNSTVSRPC